MDDTTLSIRSDRSIKSHLPDIDWKNPRKYQHRQRSSVCKARKNGTKRKEMILDFRKNKTTIPPININDQLIARVKSYKLLRMWLDDDMKWATNTEFIIKLGIQG